MSTTFYTTRLPGCLIQSVLLPLSSLTAVHLIFAAFCQSPQSLTQTNYTSGKYSVTLGLFESQHLPEKPKLREECHGHSDNFPIHSGY